VAVWDRQPGEPDEAYEAFARYLAHPEPLLGDFARAYRLNVSTVGRLAATYRWRARRAALTAHLVQARIVAAEHEARDLGAEIARHLGVAVDLAGETIQTALASGDLPSVRDALAILAEAHKQVQLGSGKPTAIVDMGGSTDADLEAAELALAALRGAGQDPAGGSQDPGQEPDESVH
jgi:hypothetical protein